MRTGYALRPVSLYNTVHTDSFTATIIIMMMMMIIIIIKMKMKMQINSRQNTAVYAPITFEEIAIVMI